MINRLDPKKKRFLAFPLLAAIALAFTIIFSPVATAKLFDGPVDRLPLEQRVSLRRGEVVFLGEAGNYTCRILAKSSMDNAWQVLTDYEHFAEFLPGIISIKVIENSGDRKVFEQINKITTFVFSIESRVQIASTEFYPEKIAFEAVEGDLETMNGKWTLQPVSPYPSAPPDQVLLVHQVKVEPAEVLSDSIFYNIYESRLEETLMAIKQEIEKRATQ